MLYTILLAWILIVMLPILPAAGQPSGVLSQANAKALVEKYHCYSITIGAAQTVLLEKWFKSIGATDQDFANFQANAERARRFACGETPSSAAPLPLGVITTRFQTTHGLRDAEAKLTLLDSLARYARMLNANCSLPTAKDVAESLFAEMRSLSGGPSPPPPKFDPTDPSGYLGSCKNGGSGRVPDVGDDIGSWDNSAKGRYRQCVRGVIANAKPAECVSNPYGSLDNWDKALVGVQFLGGIVTILAAPVITPVIAVGLVVTVISIHRTIHQANESEEQKRKDQESQKKLEEEAKKKAEAAAPAPATPSDPSATPAPTPSPTPVPAPDPKKHCDRFPLANTGDDLFYVAADGGAIGLLDSIRTCRCEARAVAAGDLRGPGIAAGPGTECQSDADRRRAECVRNPYDEHDRPREACMKLLLEDNASFNVETKLCSQIQCTRRSGKVAKVGMGANRVLACGCFSRGIAREPAARTTACERMRCEAECVCRGARCACEGSDLRVRPTTPPAPPFRPAIPEGPGGFPAPPLR
jgi:hypothetical protein